MTELAPRTRVSWLAGFGSSQWRRWGEIVRLESWRHEGDTVVRTYRVVADTYVEHLVEEADLEMA